MKNKIFFLLVFTAFWCSCYQPKYDDTQVFRYNETSGVATLDPAFAKDQSRIWITNQIFDGLVEFDQN